MTKKSTAVTKTNGDLPATSKPEVLTLVLVTKEIAPWEPNITIDARQIVRLNNQGLIDMRKGLVERIKDEKGDSTYSEIRQLQNILKAKSILRDEEGEPILHPQAGIQQEKPFDIEEQRPRNRMLWAIEDALKGRKPVDVKQITMKFTRQADLKQPKWSDAVFLCELVGQSTKENFQLGMHIVEFREKFVHEVWPETDKTQHTCLLSEAERVIALDE